MKKTFNIEFSRFTNQLERRTHRIANSTLLDSSSSRTFSNEWIRRTRAYVTLKHLKSCAHAHFSEDSSNALRRWPNKITWRRNKIPRNCSIASLRSLSFYPLTNFRSRAIEIDSSNAFRPLTEEEIRSRYILRARAFHYTRLTCFGRWPSGEFRKLTFYENQ